MEVFNVINTAMVVFKPKEEYSVHRKVPSGNQEALFFVNILKSILSLTTDNEGLSEHLQLVCIKVGGSLWIPQSDGQYYYCIQYSINVQQWPFN